GAEERDEQARGARALRQHVGSGPRVGQRAEEVGQVAQGLVGIGRRGQLQHQRRSQRPRIVERRAALAGQAVQLLGGGVGLLESQLGQRGRSLLGGGFRIGSGRC